MSTTGQVKEVLLCDVKRGQCAAGYLKELCGYYYRDKIAPGLQSAWLPDKDVFYVAVHRFSNGDISSRTVIAKATASTLEDAESQCMQIWRDIVIQVEAERKAKRAVAD